MRAARGKYRLPRDCGFPDRHRGLLQKAVTEIAAELEISKEDAAEQITQFSYLNADEQISYLDGSFAETLKSTADFLVEQKSITSAPELSEFQSRVTSEFVKKASGK